MAAALLPLRYSIVADAVWQSSQMLSEMMNNNDDKIRSDSNLCAIQYPDVMTSDAQGDSQLISLAVNLPTRAALRLAGIRASVSLMAMRPAMISA